MLLTDQPMTDQLKLNDRVIGQIKQLFGFTDADAERLSALRPLAEASIEELVAEFYRQQLQFATVEILIGDADTLSRLRNAMHGYILELFCGTYDDAYVGSRLRVGIVHKRIGVSPALYMSAVHLLFRVLSEWLEAQGERGQMTAAEIRDSTVSLNKILMFDVQFVFQTYTGALVSEVTRARDEMEHYADDLARINRELEESRSIAQRASEAKTAFLTAMSHEMRTPLNAIIGLSDLIHRWGGENANNDIEKQAKHILDAGQNMLSMVEKVLTFSQIASEKIEPKSETVDLSDSLYGVISSFEEKAMARRVEVELDADSIADIRVAADPRLLGAVFSNIVDNAILYNVEGGEVRIRGRLLRPSVVQISVSDTGPGFEPEELNSAFGDFERLGKAVSNISGTGVGLTIARAYIEAMGGRIRINPRASSGAEVWVEIPVAEAI